jgi:putative Tad-like protein involved in Flp pilus assembly
MKLRKLAKAQAAVILTLVIATLLGVMALSADVAVMYFNWIQMQKAADSAAIAGASQLTGQPDTTGTTTANAKAYAAAYACLNGLNDPNAAADAGISGTQSTMMTGMCTANAANNPTYTDAIASIDVDANNTYVKIALTRQFPYYFGKVVGLTNANVAARAKATVSGNVGTVTGGLFPAGVQCVTDATGNCAFSCNPVSASCNNLPAGFDSTQLTLAGSQTANSYTPGNWGWLNLGVATNCAASGGPWAMAVGCGGSTLASITTVLTKPGSTTGQIRHGWDFRVAQHNTFVANNPSCNIAYTSVCGGTSTPCVGDPLAVIVPLVNFNGTNACLNKGGTGGACSMAVAGFAELYLNPTQTCVDPASNGKDGCGGNAALQGCFIKTVSPDTISSSTAPATGVTSAPTLVE